jgi:outer membrane protein insertion porin family
MCSTASGKALFPSREPIPAPEGIQRVEIRSIAIAVDGETSPAALKSELRTVETPNRLSVFCFENVWERLGSPRSLFDPAAFDRDIVRLKEYFRERGFFHATIDTLFLPSDEKLDIEIHVKENLRSLIDTVKILGVERVDPGIAEDITANCLIKNGMPYTTEALEQEQVRALKIFHNGGYPDAQVDAILPVRYLSTNNITVTMHYQPGRRYLFGDVTIAGDTVEVDPNVVYRQLDFAPGEVFNEEKKTNSEQNLNRMGLLENAALKPLTRIDSVVPGSIPMQISYRVLELKEITPEVEVNTENSQFNTGLGLGYSHRNFFGNASTFSTHASVSLQSPERTDWNGALKYGLREPTLWVKADIQPQIYFPYFYGNRTSANVSLALEGEKTPAYTLNAIRGKFGITNKVATYTTGYADWTLEYVDPTILNAQLLTAIDTSATKIKQFNSIVTLTLQRDKTDNLFSPTTGFFHSLSLEESGSLPRTLGKKFGTLPYSEYVKLSFLMRQYYALNPEKSSIVATKLRGGIAQLYNPGSNATEVPLNHRFFAGGSGSVRGWNYRTLTTLDTSQAQLGGNILLDASLEERIQLFRNWGKFFFVDLEAMWGVLFIDAGNLWNRPGDMKVRDIAIAAGVGLRYETFIGPVRFDIGVRVYDPKEQPGQEWIFAKRLFRDTYSVFHFGLGHAF